MLDFLGQSPSYGGDSVTRAKVACEALLNFQGGKVEVSSMQIELKTSLETPLFLSTKNARKIFTLPLKVESRETR